MKVTFVEEDGSVRTIDDVEAGQSLMEVGRTHGVAGILADCGGACACGTCHVYVAEDWRGKVGSADEIELEMLDLVSEFQREGSRLSCQIQLTDALDGLCVAVAPTGF